LNIFSSIGSHIKEIWGGIFATFGVEEKKPKTSMLCVAMAFYRSLLCYVSSREKIEMR